MAGTGVHGCPGALPKSSSRSFLGVRDQRFHPPLLCFLPSLGQGVVVAGFNKHTYRSSSLLFPWGVGLVDVEPPLA